LVGVEAVRAGTLAQRLSMACSWASDRRGADLVGSALRNASDPPTRQRACQGLTFWRATPSWWAT
jgi:hypothetical protein